MIYNMIATFIFGMSVGSVITHWIWNSTMRLRTFQCTDKPDHSDLEMAAERLMESINKVDIGVLDKIEIENGRAWTEKE